MDDLLAELGWSKLDLSRRLGVHQNTVYKWKEAPEYAMAYLRLMVGLRKLAK